MLALVGDLFGWVPRSATWVGIVAGPLAIVGYLVGSIPFGYLLSRRRLRRQLDDPRMPRARPGPAPGDPLDAPGTFAAAALSGLAALLVATVAWDLALAATPGSATFGAIGIFSNQALGAWVSVALWTGAAAVVGHLAPPWSAFRGGSGMPPAVALFFVHAPLSFAVGAGTFLAAYALSRRPAASFLAALPVVLSFTYLAWIADLQGGWGVTNGPELTLWVAALTAALFARNLRTPEPPEPQ